MPFKVGDVVRLKSGGPPMTVTHAHKQLVTREGDTIENGVWCKWFDKEDRHCTADFHPDTLIPNSHVE